jgi:NAD(P)-dependent dehydrogenase (short-subunit alcohol dehydrogenase family)
VAAGEQDGVLRERVALVTGGGRGLGEAICLDLAAAGVRVAVADLRPESAARVAAAIEAAGGAARASRLDVRQTEDVARVVDETAAEWGGLDIVVNNAGTDVTCGIEALTVADWDAVIGTNLRGAFLVAKHAFPALRARGGGHIVNIASTASRRAWANASAYHASKWGLLGLSHALHVEGRPARIKVTAVIAGGMRTPFLLDRFPDLDQDSLQDPRHVARAVRFVLTQPPETVVPEIMVLPLNESSWP